MHSHNTTLYPMLAVGAFMAMFWTGVVAGHALGLGCLPLLLTGLLCACLGTIGVCELERRDRHARSSSAARPLCAASAPGGVAGKPSPAPRAGVRLRGEPC